MALGGVAFNRTGPSQGKLRLSERELSPSYAGMREKTENSGLSLAFRWQSLPLKKTVPRAGAFYGGANHPGWLDAAKMASLGFDAPTPPAPGFGRASSADRRQLPREVFIVLELAGPAWQEALRRAREADESVEAGKERKADAPAAPDRAPLPGSRLFAVDAGLDQETLRAKFPDRTVYAIVRGRIRPAPAPEDSGSAGLIDALSIDAVHVPLEMRAVFDRRPPAEDGRSAEAGAHFDATVVFGRRSEPWLEAATRR
ncbi:MAG: DUF4824 family protein [Burkholderiaceae bacterium]